MYHFGNVLRFLAGAAKPPLAPPCGVLPRLFIRQESPYISFVSFFTHYVGRNRSLRTFPTFYFLHTIMDVTDCIYDCKQKTDFDMIKKKINVFVIKAIKSIGE